MRGQGGPAAARGRQIRTLQKKRKAAPRPPAAPRPRPRRSRRLLVHQMPCCAKVAGGGAGRLTGAPRPHAPAAALRQLTRTGSGTPARHGAPTCAVACPGALLRDENCIAKQPQCWQLRLVRLAAAQGGRRSRPRCAAALCRAPAAPSLRMRTRTRSIDQHAPRCQVQGLLCCSATAHRTPPGRWRRRTAHKKLLRFKRCPHLAAGIQCRFQLRRTS